MLAIVAATLLLIALFVLAYGPMLATILGNIPTGYAFGDFFGARMLPAGLAMLAPAKAGGARTAMILAALYGAAIVGAIALALNVSLGAALDALPPARATLLTIGAITIAGCFLTGVSISYRCVHFFLLLPGLFWLAARPGAALPRIAALLALLFLISAFWSGAINGTAGFRSAHAPPALNVAIWLARKLGWWCLASILLGMALNRVLSGEGVRRILAIRAPSRRAA
jgi:hypothetical protein